MASFLLFFAEYLTFFYRYATLKSEEIPTIKERKCKMNMQEYVASLTVLCTDDKKWEELYVFESEGLTVIQVGSPDELPKYIAYK